MNELSKKIIKKLNHETAEYAVRDLSFLACSIFVDTHPFSFKKIFKFKDFSIIFFFTDKNSQIIFYRSGEEHNLMGKKIGEECLKDYNFAKNISDTLMRYSDKISDFISDNNKISYLRNNWAYFKKLYQDFFAYHQAVYWSSEYILKNKNKEKIKKIINILDKAYKYNEKIVPNVEKYFSKMGISDLHYNEIASNKKRKPRRSILFLDGKIKVLNYSQAKIIHEAIQKDYSEFLGKRKEIKGIIAQKGVVKGRVRLIINLQKLATCKSRDILITTQTRPQFNATIKKVAAIVTDEGGMLCHASMLAREFKIPCIVGTKIATKVLKDGDLVEVDANKGIVKILE